LRERRSEPARTSRIFLMISLPRYSAASRPLTAMHLPLVTMMLVRRSVMVKM
jgi:hypothetical protein